MRVLFLTQVLLYPLDAGPKVRAYYVLRHLAQSHDVTLVSFVRPTDTPAQVQHLEQFCRAAHTAPMPRSRARDALHLLGGLVTRQPFVIRRDHVPQMAQLVDELLATGEFDAVHADQLWMAQYALRARKKIPNPKSQTPKCVLDEHNACFLIFQRLAQGERNPLKRALLEREWRALARYEAWACAQFDHVVTVTSEDQEALKAQIRGRRAADGGRSRFTTIPICVDPREMQPVEPAPDARDVLHLGTMFFLPNVEGVLWFAREVWPHVQAQVPEATFTVVGKNPPAAVQSLANPISNTKYPPIRVTGYVPDPTPYLRQAAAFIVPLHSGGGMRVKILDAWTWGLPVVSTPIGAEGIEYRDGDNLLIADDAEGFAAAVVRVLREPALAQRLRANGRRWVEEHYNWRKVYVAWDAVYGGVSRA